MERIKIPVKMEHLVEDSAVNSFVSGGVRASASTPYYSKSHVRTLRTYRPCDALRDWLNEHAPTATYRRRTMVFYDEDQAFAFKMRWG